MDPDATLAELMALCSQFSSSDGLCTYSDVARIVELTESLDGFLRNGGFLPAAWRHGRSSAEEGGE